MQDCDDVEFEIGGVMFKEEPLIRRDWMRQTGAILGAAVALPGWSLAAEKKSGHSKKEKDEEEEISPAEDLMREHGVLKRVLLIYREVMNRIDSKRDFPPDVVMSSAKLIRAFVEDYHEKLEEDYLFPRFRKANNLVDLVDVLYQQHQKGRALTDQAMQLATAAAMKDADQRGKLRRSLYQFVRMYEPHEAREDTVLFPAFRKIVSKNEYAALGEDFEKKENQIFHGDGFEKNVDAVARIEKELGVYDLSLFTPSI
jgi:hemerythrin-like domain-containing protein